MQTIKTEIQMTDAALFEQVDGAGWEQYEWWQAVKDVPTITGEPSHAYIVTCYPNNSKCDYWEKANHITKVVTINDIAAAFNALPHAQMALLNESVDADVADQVMQVAFYGEVIFG
jgi:hypothetical protein